MESFSLLPVTIASILASYSGNGAPVEKAVIRTHISPEIAGLWNLNLDSLPKTGDTSSNLDVPSLDAPSGVDTSSSSDNVATDNAAIGGVQMQQSAAEWDDVMTIIELSSMDDNANISQTLQGDFDGFDIETEAKVARASIYNTSNNSLLNKADICHERYNFGADNKVLTTSGAEWTYGHYIYQHQESGLPMLAIVTLYDNNEVDCSGKRVDQTGEAGVFFVDYQAENNTMQWCEDKEGQNCYTSFNRLLP